MLWLNNRTPYASVGVEPCRRPMPKPKGYGFVSCFDFCYDSSRESLHFVEHVKVVVAYWKVKTPCHAHGECIN